MNIPWGAIRIPCRSAYSATHFSSAIPPMSPGSGPITSTARFSIKIFEVLAEVDLFTGVDGCRCALRYVPVEIR